MQWPMLLQQQLILSVVALARCDLFALPIIHMNDFHARFEEVSLSSTRCVDDGCIGGFSRIYATVKKFQRENPDSVFLNAGDNYQGTLWYNYYKWNVTQYFMNKLKTDAYTLGNHEFDSKIDGLIPFMKAINAPIVVSNLDDSLEPRLWGLYKKSVVITRGQRRIGVVGVILSSTDKIVYTEQLKFTDEIEAVNKEAERLVRYENCTTVIVLSHCGINVDKRIAASAHPSVGLIVGGHSHTYLYSGANPPGPETCKGPYPVVIRNRGRAVLVVQASYNSIYLGNLTVWYDEHGSVVRWEGNPIYLANDVPQDPEINSEIEIWKKSIDEFGSRVLGSSKVLLDRKMRRKGEANIGSFFTDAMVDYYVQFAGKDEWTYSSVAITNSGSLRTSIPIGDITVSDLITAQPFNNTIDTVLLTGQNLLDILEYSATPSKVRPNQLHEFLQVSGLRLVFDLSRPEGSRLTKAKILCNKCPVPTYGDIDPETTYRVIVPWYLVSGGDGYHLIKNNARNHTTGPLDTVVYENYIRKMSPITQKNDERIVVVHPDQFESVDNKSSTVLPHVFAMFVYVVIFLKVD